MINLSSVQEDREDHKTRSEHELKGQIKVEKIHRSNAGQDDRERRCKSFEDVVRILDYHGDEKSSLRLK